MKNRWNLIEPNRQFPAARTRDAVERDRRSAGSAAPFTLLAMAVAVALTARPHVAHAAEPGEWPVQEARAPALKGLIVVSRDLTKATSAAADMPPPASATGDACAGASASPAPAADPAQPKELDGATLREDLKRTGPISIGPGVPVDDQAELKALLEPTLGTTIGPDLVKSITQKTVAYLNQHSGTLVDVYFPPQNSPDGYLVLVVAPARLGKVVAKGQQHTDGQDLACHIQLRRGDLVNTKVIADDLAFLNRNPWRRTDVAFAPGSAPGETDVVLTTADQRPVRVYAGLSNAGTRLTGLGRYTVGFNWGSPFGLFDHQFDFSYTQADSARRFNQESVGYTLPLANHDTIALRGSLSHTDVPLEDGQFESRGRNAILSVEWSHPLGINPLDPFGTYPELYAGLEYKRIGNTLAFGEVPISNAVPEVFQGYVGYRGGWSDRWGHNDIDGRFTYSPGNLFGWNNDETFDASRPGSRSRYARANLTYDRYIGLPRQWQFHARVAGQFTNQPLIASEQFDVSGSSAVRGYYEDTLVTDRGVVLNLEVQTPYVRVPLGTTEGIAQGVVFADLGRGWHKSEMTDADLRKIGTTFNLASVGVGARFNVNPYVTLRADVGWRLSALDGSRGGAMAHVSAVIAY
ncbi:ShlB/FhaC/HecB family hemolysin secretion/activation protein [Burkholderia pyrrocinia]|uniref:ShlB/FhaC/HecB family hemolysin secretion/activation protein n=1 Tax=Burkholderia pyrrocinia TaxID=60550 RepID=UPI001BCE7726|nr:ShlB/FhaC/HecB family hemolysin secretion/activation protein [Burkholderia pyrrocinia]QVN23344.1 ShlB/FhaC/HecB family hemolysin secretion/activation protein [Burkholderia pyrrocinia]